MNESPVKHPRLTMSLLEEHHYCETHHLPVVCRLWRMRASPQLPVQTATYAVGLESPSRRYLYCIGKNEASARALVKRITECKLSPLHFESVVADYLWEQENGSPSETAETETDH